MEIHQAGEGNAYTGSESLVSPSFNTCWAVQFRQAGVGMKPAQRCSTVPAVKVGKTKHTTVGLQLYC